MMTLLLALSLGCSSPISPEDENENEGDDAGECYDGADNDSDGAFDCDDQECQGSPDCEGDGWGDVAAACQEYFDALNTCYTAYGDAVGVDMRGSLLDDAYCEDTYGDIHDQATADYLLCLADLYDSTDCSDADEFASIDVHACTLE